MVCISKIFPFWKSNTFNFQSVEFYISQNFRATFCLSKKALKPKCHMKGLIFLLYTYFSYPKASQLQDEKAAEMHATVDDLKAKKVEFHRLEAQISEQKYQLRLAEYDAKKWAEKIDPYEGQVRKEGERERQMKEGKREG